MKFVLPLLLLGAIYLANAQPVQERLVLVEDDMLMTKQQKEIFDQLKAGRVRRAALKDRFLWPNGEVFFTFNKNLDNAGKRLARNAMQHWEDKTCLKFRPRTNPEFERAYVEFQYEQGCRAQVGYGNTAARLISIGSSSNDRCTLGSTIHEIGHAIGFMHEHVRPDRDQYVRIIKKNMRKGKDVARNFDKASTRYIDSRGKDYDYGSIMHYSRYQANNKAGAVVLQPKRKNVEIGQRKGLSAGDIEQTKIMYKCNANDESELRYVPSPDDEKEESGDTSGPKPGEIEE